MRYIAIAILLLVTFVSCNNSTTTNTASRFYDDGRSRPVVALSTVIDSTSYDVPWSLSEELTHLIKNQLLCFSIGEMYLSENRILKLKI